MKGKRSAAAPAWDRRASVRRRSQQLAEERVIVTVPLSFRQDRLVLLDDEAIRVEILHERIRQLMRDDPDKQAFLRADGGLTVQDWMDVVDRLKEGGVEKVGLLSKLPGER